MRAVDVVPGGEFAAARGDAGGLVEELNEEGWGGGEVRDGRGGGLSGGGGGRGFGGGGHCGFGTLGER